MTDLYMPGGPTTGSGTDAWEVERHVQCAGDTGEGDPCTWDGYALVAGEGNVGTWYCPRCEHDNQEEMRA